jgi:hypothetical protein
MTTSVAQSPKDMYKDVQFWKNYSVAVAFQIIMLAVVCPMMTYIEYSEAKSAVTSLILFIVVAINICELLRPFWDRKCLESEF